MGDQHEPARAHQRLRARSELSGPVDRESQARRQRGFSLIEVILALALLGTVLIGMSGLFTMGSRQGPTALNSAMLCNP